MSLASVLNQMLPRRLRPVELATARYVRTSGGNVHAGPFRGLRYVGRAHCSALAPKLAGTYEQELHPYLQRFLAGPPDAFIDIGAAEGYYAVGAVVAGWSPRVVAFEAEPAARQTLAELMALNNVAPERIELRGLCTPPELDALLAGCACPAVLMDVEGFEALLLDPLRVPHLARSRLIVEYHDFALPGLRDELCRRMDPTHAITVIDQQPRRAGDLPASDPLIRLLPAGLRRRVLSEQRPFSHHGWLWLAPRNGHPVH
jgi:hypothetical protein